MNERDTTSLVRAIHAVIKADLKDKECASAVIAFDATEGLFSALRNVRKNNKLIEDINDMLSDTNVCKVLGGIYTVCEYEGSVWFLIKADRAVSQTIKFVPEQKIVERLLSDMEKLLNSFTPKKRAGYERYLEDAKAAAAENYDLENDDNPFTARHKKEESSGWIEAFKRHN